MIYRNFKGKDISAVGFGAMRLPTVGGDNSVIDVPKAEELIDAAYSAGVNYFDTAYGYHGENSERVLGECLSKYPRDSYYLATKFPSYDTSYFSRVEEIFEEQLRKCKVDHFDFYLLHNVNEGNIEYFLDDEKYGVVTYLVEQVRNGRIKHLGFSAHGSASTIERILDRYGEYLEFGMIQLNCIDYSFQDCKRKMEVLVEHGLPVWVMEPLRGGMLARTDERYLEGIRKTRPEADIVELSFRFLQTLPGVKVILTGMSDMDQMREKLRLFDTEDRLDEEEFRFMVELGKKLVPEGANPCTGCRYCLSYCPKGLTIPRFLWMYNEYLFTDGKSPVVKGLANVPEEKKPSACIGCRACEKVCPQGIRIHEALADLDVKTRGMF